MPIYGDASYQVTRRLELARRSLLQWNCHEIDDIFMCIEDVEANIMELQCREDQEGNLILDYFTISSLYTTLCRDNRRYHGGKSLRFNVSKRVIRILNSFIGR